MQTSFKIFSTFTGIGGLEVGIAEAARRLGITQPESVGYSEIDKYAVQIYSGHYPHHKNYGDITRIDAESLPDFDCIVGGFPCQSFSIAGKRGGFDDTRGTMFFELARILRSKRPRIFVFENVKGLLSHDEGRTFRTIIATTDELGYDVQWEVRNSKDHGVPQNRERVFIVGHLRGTRRPEVFPFVRDSIEDASIAKGEVSGTIDASYSKNHRHSGATYVKVGTLRTHKDGQGFREVKSGISPTIPARAREDGSGQPVICVPEATKQGFAEARPGQSINLSVMGSKTRRGRVSDLAQTLDTGMQQHTLTPQGGVRRLTPRECERLQGFPDDWTAGVADTQRYKTLGNAVTTNVIADIFERILCTI